MAYSISELISLVGVEEPLGIAWTDDAPAHSLTPKSGIHSCVINWLRRARKERVPVCFAREGVNCMGGWHYMGWTVPAPERILHFVTSGFDGVGGEHYLPGPGDMRRFLDDLNVSPVEPSLCVTQPLTMFAEGEAQLAVFHAPMELMNGLCSLAFFALNDVHAVDMPFGSGCANIFAWPLQHMRKGEKKTVLGGSDPSCRPFMAMDEMTLAMPMEVLGMLLEAAPRSFLTTKTWSAVRKKAEKGAAAPVQDCSR